MQAAALSHGSFYNHFASKRALIAEGVGYVALKTRRDLEAVKIGDVGPAAYVASYLSAAHWDDPSTAYLMPTLCADSSHDGVVCGSAGRLTPHRHPRLTPPLGV